jgi:NAD(P)-dependent dehydrogenase (short-subunit alcohol dehydrogenase family)
MALQKLHKSIKLNINATGFLITNLAPLLGQAGTALFFEDKFSGQKFFGSYGSTKAAQILLATSWQKETVNTGPKIKILSPAPMPTATRGRFFPGENREALSNCEAEAKCIVSKLGFK